MQVVARVKTASLFSRRMVCAPVSSRRAVKTRPRRCPCDNCSYVLHTCVLLDSATDTDRWSLVTSLHSSAQLTACHLTTSRWHVNCYDVRKMALGRDHYTIRVGNKNNWFLGQPSCAASTAIQQLLSYLNYLDFLLTSILI